MKNHYISPNIVTIDAGIDADLLIGMHSGHGNGIQLVKKKDGNLFEEDEYENENEVEDDEDVMHFTF